MDPHAWLTRAIAHYLLLAWGVALVGALALVAGAAARDHLLRWRQRARALKPG